MICVYLGLLGAAVTAVLVSRAVRRADIERKWEKLRRNIKTGCAG
jgi:hypothetical protein